MGQVIKFFVLVYRYIIQWKHENMNSSNKCKKIVKIVKIAFVVWIVARVEDQWCNKTRAIFNVFTSYICLKLHFVYILYPTSEQKFKKKNLHFQCECKLNIFFLNIFNQKRTHIYLHQCFFTKTTLRTAVQLPLALTLR